MQDRLKKEIEMRKVIPGYFLIISNDLVRREEFLKEMKQEFPEVEFFSDYNISTSVWDIWEKLRTHSVMLLNFEERLEEYVEYLQNLYKEVRKINLSREVAIYTGLVMYREFARNNPLILLCNTETAKDVIRGGQVRDFLFLDRPEYLEILEEEKNDNVIHKQKEYKK